MKNQSAIFLLNSSPVPPSISLLISVWPCEESTAADRLPHTGQDGETGIKIGIRYSFYIPGLDFKLAVGKRIPLVLQKMSSFASPERYIFSSTTAATEMMRSFGKVISKSPATGKLAREFPDNR